MKLNIYLPAGKWYGHAERPTLVRAVMAMAYKEREMKLTAQLFIKLLMPMQNAGDSCRNDISHYSLHKYCRNLYCHL